MALHLSPHSEALVSLPAPAALLPLELRILDAEASVEAAETVWRMRARDLESRPSEQALRLARWAAEDLRDAQDALETLRAEARS